MDEIDRLRDEILREIREAASPEALEAIRVAAYPPIYRGTAALRPR